LYLVFGERVDHAALYAIEKTLACRTQPCVGGRKSIACQLESMRQVSRPRDVEFVTCDLGEMARITSSYVNRLTPLQIRLTRVGPFIWLRLKTEGAPANLVFNLQSNSPRLSSSAPSSPAVLLDPQQIAFDDVAPSVGQ
ncbi:MAG: hypothetical protein WBV46_19440, partial [Terriglobales bacterium]